MPALEFTEDRQQVYEPDGRVLAEFVADRSEVAVIVGPIGSGTSSAACMRIWQHACEQPKNPRDGVRRSRWAVVRVTYPELRTSALETWLYWFPEDRYGPAKYGRPMEHLIRIGDVELEVWFLALDGEDDVKKLKSVEYTGIFFNEIEYQSHAIFIEGKSRTGRYPSPADGGCAWSGIIADMNAPDEDHFICRMAGWSEWPDDMPPEKRLKWPKEWWLKMQPPGLIEVFAPDGVTVVDYVDNPEAENLKWLKPGYYKEKARGALKQWIDARIMNRVTFVAHGEPVWKGFKPEVHLAGHELKYIPDREVVVACDFGRRPCALIAQEVGDKIHVEAEFRMYGVGATVFAPALKRWLERNYRGATLKVTGDPKGADKGQATEHSAHDIMRSYGMTVINPMPGRGNDVNLRLEAVAYAFLTNRLLIGTGCPTLRAALMGKYVIDKSDSDSPEPLKRGEAAKYSDVADALQYLCLFLGEGRRMVGLTAAQSWTRSKIAQARSLRRVSA
jgi:hypothetical protein